MSWERSLSRHVSKLAILPQRSNTDSENVIQMAPNLQQTFRTPAASKNNVYFMWDYVGRTLVSS